MPTSRRRRPLPRGPAVSRKTDADSRVRSTSPRRGHVRASARSCRSTSIAGNDAGIPRRPAPGNKGVRYPTDPPKVEEIIAVMRTAGDGAHGRRLRGLIVIMWRAGLRIQEALALTEGDLDQRSGLDLVPGADFRGAGSRYRSEAQAERRTVSCRAALRRGHSAPEARESGSGARPSSQHFEGRPNGLAGQAGQPWCRGGNRGRLPAPPLHPATPRRTFPDVDRVPHAPLVLAPERVGGRRLGQSAPPASEQ
jgi:integrase